MRQWLGWREATARALYGSDGFFRRPDGPAAHFRTSPQVSPLFARAVLSLLVWLDGELGRPPRLDVVDMGAGHGELLRDLAATARAETPELAARLRLVGVELAPRPADLPAGLDWAPSVERACPDGVRGLLFANEWLDNVPVDVVERDEECVRLVEVAPATGAERLGDRVEAASPAAAAWLADWWPLAAAPVGARAEVGLARDEAWANAVGAMRAGLAIAVDYGHLRANRPPVGTLRAFRAGRAVAPVPDGSCDITSDVAFDSCRAASQRVSRAPAMLLTQRAALRALGVVSQRPPYELARSDPGRYLRELAQAGEAAELTQPGGLGDFGWLAQPVGVAPPASLATVAGWG